MSWLWIQIGLRAFGGLLVVLDFAHILSICFLAELLFDTLVLLFVALVVCITSFCLIGYQII